MSAVRPPILAAARYGPRMALDEELLAELRRTKVEIDGLQVRLKELVARLQQEGATAQEIASALRGQVES